MTYSVKEIFYTIQGEGHHSGRPAVFCRFSGCNLWSGREQDRESAVCNFCDTDFIGTDGENGGKYTAAALAQTVYDLWPSKHTNPFVVLTGGEPLLQVDEGFLEKLKGYGCYIAVETNGTILPPPGIDWLCVSPKNRNNWVVKAGNELKLVFPQGGITPMEIMLNSHKYWFDYKYLQPKDYGDAEKNKVCTQQVVEYCKKYPAWQVSLQTHKYLGIP